MQQAVLVHVAFSFSAGLVKVGDEEAVGNVQSIKMAPDRNTFSIGNCHEHGATDWSGSRKNSLEGSRFGTSNHHSLTEYSILTTNLHMH